MSKLIKELMDAINAVSQNKTQPYDRQGEVKRIEGKIAWVKLEGSDRETPVQMTIACDVGDTVQARIGGGSAWLTGNLTAPPTDDKKAVEAISMVNNMTFITQEDVNEAIDEAMEDIADIDDVTIQYCLSDSSSTFSQYGSWSSSPPAYVSGKYYWTRTVIEDEDGNITYGTPQYSQDTQLSVETDIAFSSNNNHFWYDSSGAYVTTANKSYSSGYATRITSSGILQSYNGNLLSAWTNSGISFLAGDGTTISGSTKLAVFGTSGANFYSPSYPNTPMTEIGLNSFIIRNPATNYYCKIDQGAINFYGLTSYEHAYVDNTGGRLWLYGSMGIRIGSNVDLDGYIRTYASLGGGSSTYVKLITIDSVSSTSETFSTTTNGTISASKTGYTPIGIIGWNANGTNMSHITIPELYISGTDVVYYMRNNASSDATISLVVHVLYIATTQGV